MNCTFCNLEIGEQASSTLLCEHVCHTICLLRNGLQYNFERIICTTCDTRIIPNELVQEEYINHNEKDVKKLAETSKEFNKACEHTLVLYKKFKKSSGLLSKTMKPIISLYKTNVKAQISILKNYIKSKKKEIKNLSVYKDTTKYQNALTRSINQILNTYNLNRYELSKHLAVYGNTNRRSILWYNLNNKLNRQFRIRI